MSELLWEQEAERRIENRQKADKLCDQVRGLQRSVDSYEQSLSQLKRRLQQAEDLQSECAVARNNFETDCNAALYAVDKFESLSNMGLARTRAAALTEILNGSARQGAVENFDRMRATVSREISSLQSQIAQRKAQISSLEGQINELHRQINTLLYYY
jgi:uncharacterized protein involved in exopolysaccharide biosynthesis